MGIRFSKKKPARKTQDLSLQHHLIDYVTQSFCLRNLVSRQRRRITADGFDLDMSYITDRILAMSFPAQRMRAMYRNPLWQVKSVLDTRHYGHYKIYNLCIEESYDPALFYDRVERYPFDDNHVPQLEMIKAFCESVSSWHSADPKNIAVVHCMAGKGRTGLMVCAYLVYCGMSVEEALQLYAHRRTTNNEGETQALLPIYATFSDNALRLSDHTHAQQVSIPSQRRYVGYWANALSFSRVPENGPPIVHLPRPCSRELRRIRLYDAVNIKSVYFVVSEMQEITGEMYHPVVEVFRSCCRPVKKVFQRTDSLRYYLSFMESEGEGKKLEPERSNVIQMDTESPVLYHKTCLDCSFQKPVQVIGDVRVIFYQKMNGGRLFYACFNTAFIKNSVLQLAVQELDKVGSKGKSICGPAFCLELLFGPANVKHSFSTSSLSDFEDDDDSTNEW